MNQNDFVRGKKLQKRFDALREQFTSSSRHGIVQPIRAEVINLDKLRERHTGDLSDGPFLQSVIREVLRVSMRHGMVQRNSEVEPEIVTMDNLSRCTKVVGYVAACYDESLKQVVFGTSYCQDYDYGNFCKIFGEILAMERAMRGNCDLGAMVIDDFITADTSNHSAYAYVWPIAYGQQIAYFKNRCERYFKQIKETK